MSTPATGYGSKDQIARLLALVPYLHVRGEVRLADAAAMLGVSERQLTKDLKVLWMCGLPGGLPGDLIDVDMDALEEPGGDRIIRVDNADYLARALRLTPTEATALIVALRALRESAGSETREVVDRALGKLERASADAVPIVHVEAATDRSLDERQAMLERAIAERRQVRIQYYVPSRDEESVRVVDPHRLTRAHEATYLDAWCHVAQAPRWFRLDRIRTVETLDTPITTPAPSDREEAPIPGRTEATLATVSLAPEAHWVAEYYPVEDVRLAQDGRLEADLLVADPRWLVRLVMRVAPHARILGPAEFADLHRSSLERTRTRYADPEGSAVRS